MQHIKKFDDISENLSIDIKNESVIKKINDLIKDQSMEWAYGQVTSPGEEREMVANSFVEGANTVISLLSGDNKELFDLYNDN